MQTNQTGYVSVALVGDQKIRHQLMRSLLLETSKSDQFIPHTIPFLSVLWDSQLGVLKHTTSKNEHGSVLFHLSNSESELRFGEASGAQICLLVTSQMSDARTLFETLRETTIEFASLPVLMLNCIQEKEKIDRTSEISKEMTIPSLRYRLPMKAADWNKVFATIWQMKLEAQKTQKKLEEQKTKCLLL